MPLIYRPINRPQQKNQTMNGPHRYYLLYKKKKNVDPSLTEKGNIDKILEMITN
jgi:hypothetical protein